MAGIGSGLLPDICTVNVDTDATTAQVALAAATGVRHGIKKIIASWDADPGAVVDITIALTQSTSKTITISLVDIASLSTYEPLIISFDYGEIVGDENTAVTVSVPAGTGNAELCVLSY